MLSWRGSWYASNGVLYIKIYRLVYLFFACEISKFFNHPWKIFFYYTLPIFLNSITMKLILASPSRFRNGIDCYYTTIIDRYTSSFPSHSRHFHYTKCADSHFISWILKKQLSWRHSEQCLFDLFDNLIRLLVFCYKNISNMLCKRREEGARCL